MVFTVRHSLFFSDKGLINQRSNSLQVIRSFFRSLQFLS